MNYIIPVGLILLLIYATIKRVNCYEAFVEGAADAFPTLIKLLPNLAAMLAAISIFRSSGAVEILSRLSAPVLEALGIPKELSTLLILRPFSGSGALALLSDVLNTYGADGFIGLAASVCVGSTETIFYTMTVYCGAAGIKNGGYALPAALIGSLAGAVSGIALVKILLLM